jgi:hypothetical protein
MRIDIEKNPELQYAIKEVYLNSKLLTGCIMADDQTGVIKAYEVDKNGHLVKDGENYRTKVHYGTVKLVLSDDFECVGGVIRYAP